MAFLPGMMGPLGTMLGTGMMGPGAAPGLTRQPPGGGLQGLMANPMFMGGMGMLLGGMQQKPQQTPLADLAAGMGMAGQLQSQQMRNMLFQQQLTESKREREQRERQQELIAEMTAPGTTPQRQREIMGVIAPTEFIKSRLKPKTPFETATQFMSPEEAAAYAQKVGLKAGVQIKCQVLQQV